MQGEKSAHNYKEKIPQRIQLYNVLHLRIFRHQVIDKDLTSHYEVWKGDSEGHCSMPVGEWF